jgi:hypothetical protein
VGKAGREISGEGFEGRERWKAVRVVEEFRNIMKFPRKSVILFHRGQTLEDQIDRDSHFPTVKFQSTPRMKRYSKSGT